MSLLGKLVWGVSSAIALGVTLAAVGHGLSVGSLPEVASGILVAFGWSAILVARFER